MRGPDLVGTEPTVAGWSIDGKSLYFRWRKPGDKQAEPYVLDRLTTEPRKITAEALQKAVLAPAAGGGPGRMFGFSGGGTVFDREFKRAILNQGGDLVLREIATGKTTSLLTTDARESGASFTFDQKGAAFVAEDNLFVLSLDGLGLRQMTSFSRRVPPTPPAKPDELAKWYSEQQLELFQQFKLNLDRTGGREFGMGPGGPGGPGAGPRRRTLTLKENQTVAGLQLSPDEKTVFFLLSEPSPGERATIVPNYVTRSGFTEDVSSHAKAGYPSRQTRAGLMDAATGEVKWIDFGQGERAVNPSGLLWSPDGKTALLPARTEDRKDAWLFRLDPATGKTTVVENVRDEAWVGELGLTNVFWWPDSRFVSYISEKDGFAHLYKTAVDGSARTALTNGPFEVRSAQLSKDGQTLYLTTSEAHPGETQLYAMPAAGGPRKRITSMTGFNQVTLSPDEAFLAILHSKPTSPPELYLQPNQAGAPARRLTLSTPEEFRSYAWAEPDVLSYKARDGADVYARLYRPKNPHPSRPAVIFIHGAGYLQNAHKGWSTYYREYMFHNLLLEKGYTILDPDYRGSSGYGRDFRTGIYRSMGGKDLDDIVDGAKFLAATCSVDPNRIGIYGGSYGGFLTLMGMFKAPDAFRAGAALRPVTDWASYHPGYTVDILNLPQKDAEAYKRSSPINFAEGLKGDLLICHGMVDTNVHFQDSVRLAQRLVELGKENWELAVYPVENHSFINATSWTDEYKRILKLFESTLK
jgi:acetyl esterase/lipase